MGDEITYEPIENKDDAPKERHPDGMLFAIIFGEVTSVKLDYTESNLAALNLTISSTLPFKKYRSGTKSYSNRVTIWGEGAESLYPRIKARDSVLNINGTFIVVVASRFAGYKTDSGHYSHRFSVSRYRIVDDPFEFQERVSVNQDPSTINIRDLFE